MTEEKYTCAVTGANGYLGSRITAYLNQKGWEVYKLTRDKNSSKQAKSIYFSLENKLNPTSLADLIYSSTVLMILSKLPGKIFIAVTSKVLSSFSNQPLMQG